MKAGTESPVETSTGPGKLFKNQPESEPHTAPVEDAAKLQTVSVENVNDSLTHTSDVLHK